MKELAEDFRSVGVKLDELAAEFVKHAAALRLGAAELRELGNGPSDSQIAALWRCVSVFVHETPWATCVELVAPNERRPFTYYTNQWADRAVAQANATLAALEPQTNNEEAA
jgi:hypothetical protein